MEDTQSLRGAKQQAYFPRLCYRTVLLPATSRASHRYHLTKLDTLPSTKPSRTWYLENSTTDHPMRLCLAKTHMLVLHILVLDRISPEQVKTVPCKSEL